MSYNNILIVTFKPHLKFFQNHVNAAQALINLMENALLSIPEEMRDFSQSSINYMHRQRTINVCGGPEARERWRYNAVSGGFIVFGLGARATRGTDLRCDRVRTVSLQTRRRDRESTKSRAAFGTRDHRPVSSFIFAVGREQIRDKGLVRLLAAGESRKEIN